MNEISIAIKISRFEVKMETFASVLGLAPTHFHYKGGTYDIETSKGLITKVYEYNYWEYRVEHKTDEWPQTLIDRYIDDIIVARRNELKELKKNAALEFFVGINYFNEANPGFHFDTNRLAILSDIGFDLDLDLYNFDQ